MASPFGIYLAILILSVMILAVNVGTLVSLEKTRSDIDYLEYRVDVVENMLKER